MNKKTVKEKRKLIEENMREQLELQGKDNAYNLSKVEEYMTYYDVFQLCIQSIKEDGAILSNDVRGGGTSYKQNPALGQISKLTSAMETIARSLGIRAIDIKDDDKGVEL